MNKDEAIQFYHTNNDFKAYIDNYLRCKTETLSEACEKIIIRDIADMYFKISQEGRIYDRKGIS